MRNVRWVIAAGISLCGCAVSVSYTPTNTPPHKIAPRAAAQVELHTVAPADRPFVDIGLLEATIDTIADNRDKVMMKLRESAGRHGCDALLVEGATPSIPPAGPSVDTQYRATCLVYREAR